MEQEQPYVELLFMCNISCGDSVEFRVESALLQSKFPDFLILLGAFVLLGLVWCFFCGSYC